MKRKISIEKLLEWAFRQELCKVGSGGGGSFVSGSAWNMVSDFAALGTLIDRSPNGFGVIPSFQGEGEPHADALAAGNAVRGLVDIGFEIPAGWNPVAEFDDPHGLIALEVARVIEETRIKGDRLTGRHMAALVTGAALLGRGPDWHCEQPGFRMVSVKGEPQWFVRHIRKDAFGREIVTEESGFDRRKRRPKPGAYRKYELKQPLRGAIVSRLEWQIWQDALAFLHGRLCGQLESHELTAFQPVRFPWTAKKVQVSIENIG